MIQWGDKDKKYKKENKENQDEKKKVLRFVLEAILGLSKSEHVMKRINQEHDNSRKQKLPCALPIDLSFEAWEEVLKNLPSFCFTPKADGMRTLFVGLKGKYYYINREMQVILLHRDNCFISIKDDFIIDGELIKADVEKLLTGNSIETDKKSTIEDPLSHSRKRKQLIQKQEEQKQQEKNSKLKKARVTSTESSNVLENKDAFITSSLENESTVKLNSEILNVMKEQEQTRNSNNSSSSSSSSSSNSSISSDSSDHSSRMNLYLAFDCLYARRKSLCSKPFEERFSVLEEMAGVIFQESIDRAVSLVNNKLDCIPTIYAVKPIYRMEHLQKLAKTLEESKFQMIQRSFKHSWTITIPCDGFILVRKLALYRNFGLFDLFKWKNIYTIDFAIQRQEMASIHIIGEDHKLETINKTVYVHGGYLNFQQSIVYHENIKLDLQQLSLIHSFFENNQQASFCIIECSANNASNLLMTTPTPTIATTATTATTVKEVKKVSNVKGETRDDVAEPVIWGFLRMRSDKSQPNFEKVVFDLKKCLAKPLSLCGMCSSIQAKVIKH